MRVVLYGGMQMSKWKCEICGKEFDNFHAQGFDNKIYCPLCFFKEENRRLKDKINTYENPEDLTLMFMYCDEKAKDKIKQLKEVIEEVRELALKQIDISKKEIDRTLHLHQYDERQGLLIGQEQDIIEIQEKLLQILDKAKDVK